MGPLSDVDNCARWVYSQSALTSGVSYWLMPESIKRNGRKARPTTQIALKNTVMKPSDESCCKLNKRRGESDVLSDALRSRYVR